MNVQLVSVLIAEGGKLVSELIKNRPLRIQTSPAPERTPPVELPKPQAKPADAEAVACIPCSINHFSTCTGLLNEAMRFAREDGLTSPEVIDRIGKCTDELNALEREDLTSERIINLSGWEKELAEQALKFSRETRHRLDNLTSVEELEAVTANTQREREAIGRSWFQKRLQNMTPEDKRAMQERIMSRINELAGEEGKEEGEEEEIREIVEE